MSTKFKEIQILFGELQGRKPHPFPARGKPQLDDKTEDRKLDKQGVYIICSRKKVLHVGRTSRRRDGLRGRLTDHLQGKSSFTINWFNREGSKLRKYGYTYQFLVVGNAKKRALLEAYTTGRLCPEHVGTGKRRQQKK